MKVLIAEADPLQAEIISHLEKQGFQVDGVTVKQILEKLDLNFYDCLVIGISETEKDVLHSLETLEREKRTEGVIILSPVNTLEFKVKLLDAGADDLLVKPVLLPELAARIKAVIRRKKFNTNGRLYFANLVIDFNLKKVLVWDNPLSLTKKEYEILLHLIANKNKVTSKESLADYIWGDEQAERSGSYDFLFAHIKNLKNKLKAAKAELVIKNIYGMGYQIEEN